MTTSTSQRCGEYDSDGFQDPGRSADGFDDPGRSVSSFASDPRQLDSPDMLESLRDNVLKLFTAVIYKIS